MASHIGPEDLKRLEALHREVDLLTAPLVDRLGNQLVCRCSCCDCCQDDLTVLEIEAELIKARCGELLAEAEPAPPGQCAFLDEDGACRIYAWRPYVCRTQGLPLRWFEDEEETQEQRDICPLNAEAMGDFGRSIADLAVEDCWTLGLWEGRLASLQVEATGKFALKRIPLRRLFGS